MATPKGGIKAGTVYRWHIGQVWGAIVVRKRAWYWSQLDDVMMVTNDGITTSMEHLVGSKQIMDALRSRNLLDTSRVLAVASSDLQRVPNIEELEPEIRLPLEWAKREIVKADRATTPAIKLAASVTLPRAAGSGEIVYTGHKTVEKRSAHTLADLHAAVDECIALCLSTWGWECSGLEVKFHTAGRAFGLAYDPGSGDVKDVRRISLHVRLLEQYDIDSVKRVVLHELCHHYREETWRRDRSSEYYDAHDTTFCRELRRVDPTVASVSAKNCTYFTEEPDTALAAVVEERKAARIKEPTWAPAAGIIVFSRYADYKLKIEWQPRRDAGFSWTKYVGPATGERMADLAKHFALTEWEAVTVKTEFDLSPAHGRAPENLRELLDFFLLRYPLSAGGALNVLYRDLGLPIPVRGGMAP